MLLFCSGSLFSGGLLGGSSFCFRSGLLGGSLEGSHLLCNLSLLGFVCLLLCVETLCGSLLGLFSHLVCYSLKTFLAVSLPGVKLLLCSSLVESALLYTATQVLH